MLRATKKKPPSAESLASPDEQSEPGIRRLNLKLTARAYTDLSAAARRKGCTMTELIRWGIALMIAALNAAENGEKVAIVSKRNKVMKELLLPN